MNKQDTQNFLENGGSLIRYRFTAQKEHVLQKKSINSVWHIGLTCTNKEICDKTIDTLLRLHPDKFQRG